MTNDEYGDFVTEVEYAEDEDIRRAALGFISDAWAEAVANGVDPDAVAHAAMFTALADLVSTYGEDAVAKLAEGLPERIARGDYTVNRVLQ
ncbi:conserved hypothetical protein [Roseibium sp. TrichSKD4]|uniref:hypothetical protein n=1 Tax=Roseibium sp. TrichSKD4 TaxID=744980 RepID=UPI0001E5611A|nr:hypothetical protein [Roseibium sp. TrichSKD4]EFO34381.1 conserved hypothetical protein [Roseibium sp. TrichSKD4]